MQRLLFMILLLCLFSCSSDKPGNGGAGSSAPPQGNAGGRYALEITPRDPTRASTLTLTATGFNLSGATIEWLVNGNPFTPPEPTQFQAADTRKGVTVQARATIGGSQVLSNEVQIVNTAPEITKVQILPEVFTPEDRLRVEAAASDLDEDEVAISYEWKKNGEPAGSGTTLESAVKRGDVISLAVTPYDGQQYGRPVVVTREIRNLPPAILQSDRPSLDGSLYTYQAKALDPDGDRLTYSLEGAPKGMTINAATGLVQWVVPADAKGMKRATLVVTDGQGGIAKQELEITID